MLPADHRVDAMTSGRIESFEEFWPFYIGEHRLPLVRALHYFGTSMGEVFASRDGGDSWQRLPGTFPRITSVKVMER